MSEQQSPTPAPPSAQQPASEPRQGASRYPRTYGGLIGSMIVLVIALLAYWGLQHTHSAGMTDESVSDWQSNVAQIQTVETIAYPGSVPPGWSVTSADWDTDDTQHPLWKLGMVTPDQQFVGIYEQAVEPADLVAQTTDQGRPHSTGTVRIPTAVGDSWQAWVGTDDREYSIAVGSTTLVVYGTNDTYVRQLMGLLTTKKLPQSAEG